MQTLTLKSHAGSDGPKEFAYLTKICYDTTTRHCIFSHISVYLL
ncbi:MAG: hypothetical protein ABFS56_01235 [Pseudomonadota bacterium]